MKEGKGRKRREERGMDRGREGDRSVPIYTYVLVVDRVVAGTVGDGGGGGGGE